MFLKEHIPYKIVLVYFAICILSACTGYNSGQKSFINEDTPKTLSGKFTLDAQVIPPAAIQSVQLYPGSVETAPPVIALNGGQSLTLEFDYLSTQVKQFNISVSHRNKNWQESAIGPSVYLDRFFEASFGDGRKSFEQNPPYHHYTYRFPNQRLSLTKSGNYLLSVFEYGSDELLFSLPFFVSEDRGTLETRIERLFAQRDDGRSLAQPFSDYRYPGFVQQPQFDLSFAYVQNQFWGRMRYPDFFDTATPGIVHFHLERRKAFIADYEFNLLDLRSFNPDGRQIIDIQPGQTPPIVTLRRDVQQFESTPNRFPGPALGLPNDDLRAQYGRIKFSFNPISTVNSNEEIYLVGQFNNWVIDPRFRMRFDSTAALWKTDALIKQGLYAYKYVRVDEEKMDDLAFDQNFTNSRQEYLTFVYYRDPQQNFDRLLKVERTTPK